MLIKFPNEYFREPYVHDAEKSLHVETLSLFYMMKRFVSSSSYKKSKKKKKIAPRCTSLNIREHPRWEEWFAFHVEAKSREYSIRSSTQQTWLPFPRKTKRAGELHAAESVESQPNRKPANLFASLVGAKARRLEKRKKGKKEGENILDVGELAASCVTEPSNVALAVSFCGRETIILASLPSGSILHSHWVKVSFLHSPSLPLPLSPSFDRSFFLSPL